MKSSKNAALASIISNLFKNTKQVVLGLLLLVLFVGGLNLGGELKVEALDPTKGVILFEDQLSSAANRSQCFFVNDTQYGKQYFCPDPNAATDIAQYLVSEDNCTDAVCVDSGKSYGGCILSVRQVRICSSKLSNSDNKNAVVGESVSIKLNGALKVRNTYRCTINYRELVGRGQINYLSLSDCTKDGKSVSLAEVDSECVAFVNNSDKPQLSCEREPIIFGDTSLWAKNTPLGSGDSSQTLTNWRTPSTLGVIDSNGRVVKTTDNGSLLIENSWYFGSFDSLGFGNPIDSVCTSAVERVPLFGSIGAAVTDSAVEGVSCDTIKTLGEFKDKLKAKTDSKNHDFINKIASGPELVVSGPSSIIEKKECKKFTKAQVASLRGVTDKTKEQKEQKELIQQIDKLIKDKNWDGEKDLELCNSDSLICSDTNPPVNSPSGSWNCVDRFLKGDVFGPGNVGGKITSAAAAQAKSGFDELGTWLFKVVVWVMAWLLLIIGNAGFFILWSLGGTVLWILDQNPGTPASIELLKGPWGLLAGIGNMMILGAFIYTGFGYLLGIKNLQKDIGEFIQKIVYYALILNFTLSGLATLVNVGYGVGNLIKISYSTANTKEAVNQNLIGNLLNGIGGVSQIRCGTVTPNCKVLDPNTGASVKANDGKQFLDSIFGGIGGADENARLASAMTAIVMEFITIGMMIIAGIVLWRALYTTFYRFMGILFILMLSPIGAASLFSPVDSWQSVGKQMWDKFWKMVAFYPAFIFGLILVNLLASGFAEVDKTKLKVPTSTGEALTGLLTKVVGAGISIMGLWLITDYFAKSFEADMNKFASGVKTAATQTWGGLQKAYGFGKGAVKVGSGAVKLGGGTLANAGRLVSWGSDRLGFKDRDNKAAIEKENKAKKLRELLAGNIDEKGNALTDKSRKDLLNKAKGLERASVKLKDRANRGFGGSLISAGNTLAFAPDRIGSTAKNVGGYFKKFGEAVKKEDSKYWSTASSDALKRMGQNELADSIFSDSINKGLTGDSIKADKEDGGRYNEKKLQDSIQEIYKSELGYGDFKLSDQQALTEARRLMAKAQGDLGKLSDAEQNILEQLIDQGVENDLLGRTLFGNDSGASLVRQMDKQGSITNGKTTTKLSEKWGNTLANDESAAEFGRLLAKDVEKYKDADASVFNDSRVKDAFEAAGGDPAKVIKDKGSYGNLFDNDSLKLANQRVNSVAPVTGADRDVVNAKVQALRELAIANPVNFHQALLDDMAELHDKGYTDKEYMDEARAALAAKVEDNFAVDNNIATLVSEGKVNEALVEMNKDGGKFDVKDPATAKALMKNLLETSSIAIDASANVSGFDNMTALQQVAVIKQATMEQLAATGGRVDSYLARNKTTSKAFNSAKKSVKKATTAHAMAKKDAQSMSRFAKDNSLQLSPEDLSALQSAMITSNTNTINEIIKNNFNGSDPAQLAALQRQAGSLSKNSKITAGAAKIADDLQDELDSVDKLAAYLAKEVGSVDPKGVANLLFKKVGSDPKAKKSLTNDLGFALATMNSANGVLDTTTNKDHKVAADILKQFGLEGVNIQNLQDSMQRVGANVYAGLQSQDPNQALVGFASKQQAAIEKKTGERFKKVQELDPTSVTLG